MKTTKRLLALLLCVLMLPVASLAAFAEMDDSDKTPIEDGTVLYYQRFNWAFGLDELSDAGLTPGDEGTALIDPETGYLKGTTVTYSTTRKKIVTLTNVIPTDGTYTVEYTYRTTFGSYDSSSVQLGWATEGTTILELTGNTGLKFTYNGGTTSTQNYQNGFVDDTGFKKNQHVSGNWITVKVEVTDGVLTGHSFDVNGKSYVYDVTYENYNNEAIVATDLYFRMKDADADFSSIRVIKGVDYTEYKGEYATKSFSGHLDSEAQNGTAPRDTVAPNSGNVLYYQCFDKSFGITDLSTTGLTFPTAFAKIGDNGYMAANTINDENNYNIIAAFPDVIPDRLRTYTVETTFRFEDKGTKSWGGLQLAFGEGAQIKLFLRYNNGGKFDSVATQEGNTVSTDVNTAWLADDFGAGSWATLKVQIKDDRIHKVIVEVDNKYTGQVVSWSTDAPEYDDLLPDDDMLYIRQAQASICFKSLRIVEGVDYTSYTGDYATKSYSGHEDPIETNDEDNTSDANTTVPKDEPETSVSESPGEETDEEKDTDRTSYVTLALIASASIALVVALIVCTLAVLKRRRKEKVK